MLGHHHSGNHHGHSSGHRGQFDGDHCHGGRPSHGHCHNNYLVDRLLVAGILTNIFSYHRQDSRYEAQLEIDNRRLRAEAEQQHCLRIAAENKNLRLLAEAEEQALYAELDLIIQNEEGHVWLEVHKYKIKDKHVKYLIEKDAHPSCLQWLLEHNLVSFTDAQKLKTKAIARYNDYPLFANAYFSSNICIFGGIDESIRLKCLRNNSDIEQQIRWYTSSYGYDAVTHFHDTNSSLGARSWNIFPSGHVTSTFSSLDKDCLECIIDQNKTHVLLHLIKHQSDRLKEVFPSLSAEHKMSLIQTAPRLWSPEDLQFFGQHNVVEPIAFYPDFQRKILSNLRSDADKTAREKILLCFIKAQLEKLNDAPSVIRFASMVEAQLKVAHCSDRSVSVMLKLAKNRLFSMLDKNQPLEQNAEIAAFMSKNRSVHYFFGMPFQLTMFSTTSSSVYKKLGSDGFASEVQMEKVRGDAEFTSFVR